MSSDAPRGSTPSTAAAASTAKPRAAARPQTASAHNDGWLMAVELVTATLTWGGIGYLVDRYWLHTYPVFMSIGFVVGFFAGMYLLWLKTSTAAPSEASESRSDAGA